MAMLGASRAWLSDRRDTSCYLQVTAHPGRHAVTLSHWQGRVCVASTVVDIDDVPELVSVLTASLAQAAAAAATQPDRRPILAIAAERLRERISARTPTLRRATAAMPAPAPRVDDEAKVATVVDWSVGRRRRAAESRRGVRRRG